MSPLRFIIRLPVWLATGIALLLFAGWLLFALGANENHWLVAAVMDGAGIFADPFRNIFTLDDQVAQMAVNWGIAAAVYLAIGVLISALLARLASALTAREGRSGSDRSPREARS
jgi:energy-coupling factor transporter transmembrane protein EcfT